MRSHIAVRVALLLALTARAAVAAPAHRSSGSSNVMLPHPPTLRQHTEFTVETNKLGQVTRATKVVRSDDRSFNAITYGNALQAFIRTPDGKGIAGVYVLSYDYNPATKMVHRGVRLVHMGGVNPNAPGAVTVEAGKVQQERNHVQAAQAEASALPGLHQMTRHHH